MKYLTDYTQEAQSKLFDELGVFFAFSTEQFKEGAKKHAGKKSKQEKWASLGMGMYMPSKNVDEFTVRHKKLTEDAIKQDLADNGKTGVLNRELGNYEIGYAWEGHRDANFRDAIRGYGFTEEEIETAYKKHMNEVEY